MATPLIDRFLLPRDPDAPILTRRFIDRAVDIWNSLLLGGFIVPVPGGNATSGVGWQIPGVLPLLQGNYGPVPGLAGDDGETGWPGPPGRDGATGAIGPPGMMGFDGDEGLMGAPGVAGAAGATGATGATGAAGADGAAGAAGAPGMDGDGGSDFPFAGFPPAVYSNPYGGDTIAGLQGNERFGFMAGKSSESSGRNTCIGYKAGTGGSSGNGQCTVIGALAGVTATGQQNTLIGGGADVTAGKKQCTVIGVGAVAQDDFGIAIGQGASCTGSGGTAVGTSASAAVNAVAIGGSATAGGSSVVIGNSQTLSGSAIFCIGQGSTASANLAGTLGQFCSATHTGSYMFGYGGGGTVGSDATQQWIYSTGGIGSGAITVNYWGASSTTARKRVEQSIEWADNTDATRRAKWVFKVLDTASRIALTMETDGARGTSYVPAGGSTGTARIGGTTFDHFTDGSSSHTDGTEDDLYTDTTAAATLSVNGDKIEAWYGGAIVGHATATRKIKVYFAGTAIFDSTALTSAANSSWTVAVKLIRVSATVVRYMVDFQDGGLSAVAPSVVGELTALTLSGTNILKVTGAAAGVGAAAADIVAKMGTVKFFPAA